MWSKALFVGCRPYKRKEYVNENGEVIPGFEGIQYLFYCADWPGENKLIEDMGRTRFDTRKNDDLIQEELQIGDFCTVNVKEQFGNQQNSLCKFVKKEE